MALDIRITDGSSPQPLPGEPMCQFGHDEGVYWFLHPLFARLWKETGQYIDLYGDASFAGDGLVALKRMLVEARKLTESQPASWQVHVGTQTAPVRCEVYRLVDRDAILAFLASWERIVDRAAELGKPVLCIGD